MSDFRLFLKMVWEKSDIFFKNPLVIVCNCVIISSCQKSLTEIAKLTLETGIT